MNKKNVINKLCTVAVISCLAIAPVFAMEEIKYEKEIIKAVKKDKVENVTQEYLDNIDMLVFKQGYENQDFKKALKTADYRIKAKEAFYGKNSIEVRDAYFSKAELALHAGLVEESTKAYIEAKKISGLNPQEETLKEKIDRIDEVRNNAFENATESAKYLEKREQDVLQRKLGVLVYQSQAGDVKNVLKELKKLENKAIKTKNNELLASVYEQRINLLCEINNYKEMWEYIEKAEKVLPDFPHIKGTIDYVKVTYYKEMSQYEKAIEQLNANYKKDTDNDKLSYYATLFDVEKDAKNYKEAAKCAKNIEKILDEKYPEKSIQFTRVIYDKFIDLYKDMNNDKKVLEYLEKYREIVEPIKEQAPILYAKYLEKLGNYQSHKQDYQNAKSTFLQSVKLYEEYDPKSHALANLYRDIANVDINMSNLTSAIDFIKKAISHNVKYYSDTSKDLSMCYIHFANLYSKSNDFERERMYLNKGITLSKHIFGNNNVKTLQNELKFYNFYRKISKEKSNEVLKKINEIAFSDKRIGSSKDFSYDLSIANAEYFMEKDDYRSTIKELKEIPPILNDENKRNHVNYLKYCVYKQTGNKIKALRYKKLAGIKD